DVAAIGFCQHVRCSHGARVGGSPQWTDVIPGEPQARLRASATRYGETRDGESQLLRSSRAIRNSISAIASFDNLIPGLRCASEAIAPRRLRIYLRTASPSIPGCCS